MNHTSDAKFFSENLVYMEQVYQAWRNDPNTVSPEWRQYFDKTENGQGDQAVFREAAIPGRRGTTNRRVFSSPAAAPLEVPTTPAPRNDQRKHSAKVDLEKVAPGPILDILKHVPLFYRIDEDELAYIAQIAKEEVVAPGKPLCAMGQELNDLFFLLEGYVAIMRNDREITQLGPGEMVGELAVFDSRPRSADIVAKTQIRMLRIRRRDLQELLLQNSALGLGLLRSMAGRLRDAGRRQEMVDQLVRAYRERGHVMASIDPLGLRNLVHPELDPEYYGFQEKDLDVKFDVMFGQETSGWTLREILRRLRETYCQAIGVQYMHIDDLEIQKWLRVHMEEPSGRPKLTREEQVRILRKLTDAETLENFIHRKFVGAKRFSLEGGESLIPLLDSAIEEAGTHGVDEIIIGMAHRGRLNVLVNVMEKPAAQVFREFEDVDPELHHGRGDVKYHLGYSTDRVTASGHRVHLSLCFNPSHLEFVGPVAMGRVRAKQDRFKDYERTRAMPLVIHGDAAFAGQGVVQEMFNLSELPGYSTGGTVHVILNNQIGFTTDPEEGRSTQYATDVARMLQIPIFHVNGEEPEAVAQVIRLAMKFRDTFKKDVVIDMYCYRKYGHNEGDEPMFTQPVLYSAIKKRKSIRKTYVQNLLKLGGIEKEEAEEYAEQSKQRLEEELEKARAKDYRYQSVGAGHGIWAPFVGTPFDQVSEPKTGLDRKKLDHLFERLTTTPEGFTPHSKIQRFLADKVEMGKGEKPIDWGTGEALAFGSLLAEGVPIRISGQDSERGTFSHRHAVLHDTKTGDLYTPLANVEEGQGRFECVNSPLSEIAVLGYEYGYSLDRPDALSIWEAQFGDFCNVAQVIIDQFITSSQDKWSRYSGLCLFLPHGFEGQGPEHSSARLERFLMLAAENNIQVVNLTTPAQLFHCLRRQIHRKVRRPLVAMSPKSLLRHPKAVSTIEDLVDGHYQMVISDVADLPKGQVRRVLLCSGKVYYELEQYREEQGIDNVALIRVEQYYPLPYRALKEALSVYAEGTEVVWVQEEPLNMGAWPMFKLKLGQSIEGNGVHPLSVVSRPESASPATGSAASHRIEQKNLIERAFRLS